MYSGVKFAFLNSSTKANSSDFTPMEIEEIDLSLPKGIKQEHLQKNQSLFCFQAVLYYLYWQFLVFL